MVWISNGATWQLLWNANRNLCTLSFAGLATYWSAEKKNLLIIEYLMEIIKCLAEALTAHFQFSSSYSRDLSLTRRRSWTVQWNSISAASGSWNFVGETFYLVAIMHPKWSNIWNSCRREIIYLYFISNVRTTSQGPIGSWWGARVNLCGYLVYYSITIIVEHSGMACCISALDYRVKKDGKKEQKFNMYSHQIDVYLKYINILLR